MCVNCQLLNDGLEVNVQGRRQRYVKDGALDVLVVCVPSATKAGANLEPYPPDTRKAQRSRTSGRSNDVCGKS